jgi:hypothetical protein
MPTGLVDLATAEWLGQGIFAAGDTSLPLEDQQRDIICGLESFGLGPVHSFSDNEELWAVSPSSSYLASSTSTSSPPSVGPLPGPPAASLASHADADEALASSVQQKLTPVYNLVHRRQGNPASKHAASLISHIVSAFPQMMLRRQTFPPFIHAYWHRPNVPEILGNCMSIAQLYAVRTPETRPFLWRSIETEHKRFRKNVRLLHAFVIVGFFELTFLGLLAILVLSPRDTAGCSSPLHLHHYGYCRSRRRDTQAGRKSNADLHS